MQPESKDFVADSAFVPMPPILSGHLRRVQTTVGIVPLNTKNSTGLCHIDDHQDIEVIVHI